MNTENEKIKKHIGEQEPIIQSDQSNTETGHNGNSDSSNQSEDNPLKPQETKKGVKSNQVEKR